MEENDIKIKTFLNNCGIVFDDFNHLDGMLIPRELLLSDETYIKIKPDIIEIKKIFSSSSLTSLQTKAILSQKWPLLNLTRQILKQIGFVMNPKRKSAGYTENGKKKYNRFFEIKKLKQITKETVTNIESCMMEN